MLKYSQASLNDFVSKFQIIRDYLVYAIIKNSLYIILLYIYLITLAETCLVLVVTIIYGEKK